MIELITCEVIMSSVFVLAALIGVGSSFLLAQSPKLLPSTDLQPEPGQPQESSLMPLGTLHHDLWRLPTTVIQVRISEGFNGYAQDAPFGSFYALQRDGFSFTGDAEYSAGGYFKEQQSMSQPVTVADTGVMAFLNDIADIPVREGTEDAPVVLDAYYNMSIRLSTADGDLVLRTESAFADHVPWNIEYGDRRYTTRSPQVYGSYTQLLKALPHDQLRNLRETVVRSPNKQ